MSGRRLQNRSRLPKFTGLKTYFVAILDSNRHGEPRRRVGVRFTTASALRRARKV